MILQRLATSIRKQDWVTVVIETLIVVFGVFIGLQVNNWNGERADRALERIYIERLTDDLSEDVRRIDWLINIYETKQRLLLVLRDGPVSAALAGDPKEAALDLSYTEWKGISGPRRGTYDELIGSGNLSLVQDVVLRNVLSDYYSQYSRTTEIVAEPIGDYKRRFAESVPGDIAVENLELPDDPTIARLIAGLEMLTSDPGFEQAANAELYYGRDMVNWLKVHRAQAVYLLSMLDGEPAR